MEKEDVFPLELQNLSSNSVPCKCVDLATEAEIQSAVAQSMAVIV